MYLPISLDDGALAPRKAHSIDAGFDLHANCIGILPAGQTIAIPTGVHLGIPEGWEGQIRPRSGLSLQGITVKNSPGTIDAGYTGEVKVILHNDGDTDFEWDHGGRIAQLVIKEVPHVILEVVDDLDQGSARGDRGFGSTGTRRDLRRTL